MNENPSNPSNPAKTASRTIDSVSEHRSAVRSDPAGDGVLLERVKANDQGAMAEFCDRYGSLVYMIALRVLKDPSQAEDLMQEVFLQVWRNPGAFVQGRGSLGAWLAVVTRTAFAICLIVTRLSGMFAYLTVVGPSLRQRMSLVDAGAVCAVGQLAHYVARQVTEGEGVRSPGFIDVHTHDDTSVIRDPQMMPKLSQGVTTVIVGNCGISAAPVQLKGPLPDPMNLLGEADAFRYPTFASYVAAVDAAQPAVNVAALAGHTSLRNNHMDRLDRAATAAEIQAMRAQLIEALDDGALGLSSGLAYGSARSASAEEILSLAEPLAAAGAIYATTLRTEAEQILAAMSEAFAIGRLCNVPVVISHLKCAGIDNWGRSGEVLHVLETARAEQPVQCDCYPYAASSSTLDLRQVDERVRIVITWSTPTSRNGRPDAGADRPCLGHDARGGGGALATCGGHLPLHDGRRCAPHPASPRNHDRLRRPAQRPPATPPPVGNVSSGAGLLLP